jgi:hypothetical protein
VCGAASPSPAHRKRGWGEGYPAKHGQILDTSPSQLVRRRGVGVRALGPMAGAMRHIMLGCRIVSVRKGDLTPDIFDMSYRKQVAHVALVLGPVVEDGAAAALVAVPHDDA